MRRMITILYGEMGSGKTFHGQKAAARAKNTVFVEGDAAMPQHMRARVKQFRPLTSKMIDTFVRVHLAEAIANAARFHNVVVAQALYRREHRAWLKKQLEDLGHEVHLIEVKVSFIQNLRQLLNLPWGLRWVLYWLLNKPFYQR